jgi:predicted  nucleic acid-binding Zn-ribbon protein
MEKRMESFGKEIEDVKGMKSVPEVLELPKIPPPGKEIEDIIKNLKSSLDNLSRRLDKNESEMKDFARREDLTNLEEILKKPASEVDKKLISGSIYQELDEIRKSIIENKEKLVSVISDINSIRKELGSLEEKEWGAISKKPEELESIKKKVEVIENKLKLLRTKPHKKHPKRSL